MSNAMGCHDGRCMGRLGISISGVEVSLLSAPPCFCWAGRWILVSGRTGVSQQDQNLSLRQEASTCNEARVRVAGLAQGPVP